MGALYFLHVLECLAVYLIARFTKKKWLVWLISLIIIINYQGYLFTKRFEIYNLMKFVHKYIETQSLSNDQREIAVTSFASLVTLGYHRIISFNLDMVDEDVDDEKYSFLNLLFYSSYYPFALTEPIINYGIFYRQVKEGITSNINPLVEFHIMYFFYPLDDPKL